MAQPKIWWSCQILHTSGSEKRTGKKLKMEKLCKVRLSIYQTIENRNYARRWCTGYICMSYDYRLIPCGMTFATTVHTELLTNETQQKLEFWWALTWLLLPAVLPNYWSYSPAWQSWPWSWSSEQSPVLPTLPSSPYSAFRAAFSLSPVSASLIVLLPNL